MIPLTSLLIYFFFITFKNELDKPFEIFIRMSISSKPIPDRLYDESTGPIVIILSELFLSLSLLNLLLNDSQYFN
jgi:hypothetical protein